MHDLVENYRMNIDTSLHCSNSGDHTAYVVNHVMNIDRVCIRKCYTPSMVIHSTNAPLLYFHFPFSDQTAVVVYTDYCTLQVDSGTHT